MGFLSGVLLLVVVLVLICAGLKRGNVLFVVLSAFEDLGIE